MNNKISIDFKKTKNFKRALTHSSFSTENYERLEFLGDSILDFLIADYFYLNTNLSEGELTRIRANFVSKANLSKLFDALELTDYCRLGKSCPGITNSIKCDMLESIIASIYIDYGIEECKKFVLNNFNLSDFNATKDYKTQLQEYCQGKDLKLKYTLKSTEGEGHLLTFYVNVKVNDKILAEGNGKSKHEAEQICAKLALKKLNLV